MSGTHITRRNTAIHSIMNYTIYLYTIARPAGAFHLRISCSPSVSALMLLRRQNMAFPFSLFVL